MIGKIYKDEIRSYVISEINKEIEVKINVRTAEFSILRKFPFISIVFTDVVVLSGKDFDQTQFTGISTDTLFNASRIYLQFNLFEILRKDYQIRKVHAVNGKINILVDNQGNGNFQILKERGKGNKSTLTFGLDGVKLSGFSWQFMNLVKEIHSEGQINQLALKGKFSQNSFSLNSLASLYIKSFKREEIEYASKLKLDSRLILNVRDSVYTISRGDLSLNGLNFKTGGSFTTGIKTFLDFKIAGENLNIKSLITTLPIHNEVITKLSPTGKAEILIKIIGEVSNTLVPSIKAAFKISNGKVFLPELNSNINNITIKGTYSNGSNHNASTSRLNLNEYSINYRNNLLNGKLSIDNFLSPFLSASTSGSIIAKDLSDILKINGLHLEKGIIFPDLSVNINLESFRNFNIHNISANGINGNLEFKEISGKTPFSELPLDLLEGKIRMEDEMWFPEFQIKLGKNNISANLEVNNFWEHFVNNSKIPEIYGEIVSEYLSITDFLSKSSSTDEMDFRLPDSIVLNLHCKVDSFIYGKFLALDLETWFKYNPGLLSTSYLKMQTMAGTVSAHGAIIADKRGLMFLRASGALQNININKLFYAFNNFGQDFILAENLKGSVSGKIDFSAFISPKLELLTKNLTAQSEFVIIDGELINFEPITELSSFVKLSELQHIKFSTLKNSILIKDEKVYIPQMDINSSAFNITISGTHGFNNYFEYKLRLSLSEILASKAKKAKKENDEFGIIEDNGKGSTNLYLSLEGTPEDFKIKYDKKEAIIKIKSDLKEEKKLLKAILKEELGLFKKDTVSAGNKNKNSDQDQFIMDWGDEKITPDKPLQKENDKKVKKKDPAFDIIWEEDGPHSF